MSPAAAAPEHRIDDGVHGDIGVGVPVEAARVRDLDASENEPASCGEGVCIETVADTHRRILLGVVPRDLGGVLAADVVCVVT